MIAPTLIQELCTIFKLRWWSDWQNGCTS